MFDNLSLKLEKAFQSLKGQGRITEINVANTIKEIRKALIDADVKEVARRHAGWRLHIGLAVPSQ